MEKKNPFSEGKQNEGFVAPSKQELARASKERRRLLNEKNAHNSPSSGESNAKKRDLDKEARIDLKRKDNLSPKGLYV
ncbi:Uncharacterised protein [uncultured archaeon]|nr:Uncharacterised protein [uncultured archaeon]